MEYYTNTRENGKKLTQVISLEEYTDRLMSDEPESILFDWSFLEENSCYTNAEFLCSYNHIFQRYKERFNYCEGVVVNKREFLDDEHKLINCVHHSWVYSHKYNCYVDCTPNPNLSDDLSYNFTDDWSYNFTDDCDYYLSDELTEKKLEKFINSLINTETEEYEPRFIHKDEPLGTYLPKEANL